MTRVARLLHLDDGEFPALRAQIEAKPIPAPSASKPANWGRDIVAFLRSEAPVEPRTLGMRRPAAPRPFSTDLITRLALVSTAMHADYTRHLDTMAVLDDITAALTEHPEFLTSAKHHPGPRLWLRRIAAELAPYTAETEEQKQAVALEQQYAAMRAEDAALDAEAELALYDTESEASK